VKDAIWSESPGIAIPQPRLLEESFGALIAERRFSMILLSLFGILGVTIASVGIYGVMTHVVTLRTHEFGIRMALGARRSVILSAVLMRALRQVAAGLAIGLAVALLLATPIAAFVFEVSPHDPRVYAVATAVLTLTAVAAALIPARRAARVDPLIAMRME
jgi:ABC-type antimicrobial peptide transport system permease subunit